MSNYEPDYGVYYPYIPSEDNELDVCDKESILATLTRNVFIMEKLNQLVLNTTEIINSGSEPKEKIPYATRISDEYYIIFTVEIIDYDIDYKGALNKLQDQIFDKGNGTYDTHELNKRLFENKIPFYRFDNGFIICTKPNGIYEDVAVVKPSVHEAGQRISQPLLYMNDLTEKYTDILDNKKFVLHSESMDETLSKFCKYHITKLQKD